MLAAAEALTPSKLRARVAAAVAAVDPRDAEEQHEDACAARAVKKYPREHGMAGIWALLPADHAAAVWAAVNAHAEASRGPGDQRTADQRRADSLTDLMTAYLDGQCPAEMPPAATGGFTGQEAPSTGADVPEMWPEGQAPPTSSTQSAAPADQRRCWTGSRHPAPTVPEWCRVQIKISVDWLLGRTTEAPELTGYGPLPSDVAVRLIADAGWQRIVYDPLTGALLDVGTSVHDPPAALRRHVLARDGGCTQPICGNPRVDLDHNVPFPHGPTSAVNLRSRCRHDHHLKQHSQWHVRVAKDGRIEWVSPTGHSYPEHEPDLRAGVTTKPRRSPPVGPDPAASPDVTDVNDVTDDAPPV